MKTQTDVNMARTLRPSMITIELKDITISEAKIESVGEEIGRGAYGRVFTVKYCGWVCAAKEIRSILLEGVGLQEQQSIKEGFLRECYHCSILSHPNIIRFIGVYYPKADSNIPVMIMELMDESLVAYMEKLPKNALKRKNSILVDVAVIYRQIPYSRKFPRAQIFVIFVNYEVITKNCITEI